MGFPAEGFSIFMVKVPAVSFRNYPSLLCFSALSQTIWTRSGWLGGWEKSDLVSSTPYFYISTQEQGNWVRIFSIAIGRRVHFKQIWIPGLKQNDILSLSLSLSFYVSLFSLFYCSLCCLRSQAGSLQWMAKMSMLKGIKLPSPPKKSLQREQEHF